MTYRLILLRHGHSDWNAKNLFTGWVDVDLNAQGVEEAQRGGELLRDRDLLPDVLHTSVLTRAIRTANIALEVADRQWIDVRRSWRPWSFRSTSTQPVKRFLAFQSLWPWRSRIRR